MAPVSLPEPWLRATPLAVGAVAAQVLYTFTHVVEDLERWMAGVAEGEIWR